MIDLSKITHFFKLPRDYTPWMLFGLCLVIYGNTLWNAMMLDERQMTFDNPEFQAGIYPGELFHAGYFFYSQESFYRPVTTASYLMDYRFWGNRALGYRFNNLFLHFQASWGLYVLLLGLLGQKRIARVAALFFMLHPLASEAVCSVLSRNILLATSFSLWALAAYVHARSLSLKNPDAEILQKPIRWYWIGTSLVFFATALFSSEMAFLLLPVFILLEFLGRRFPREKMKTIASLLPIIMIWLLALWVRVFYMINPMSPASRVEDWTLWQAVLRLSVLVFSQIRLMLLPLQLSVGWEAPEITSILQSVALPGLVVWVAFLAGLWLAIRKHSWFALAGTLLLVGIVPLLELWRVGDITAERHLYFALSGFCLIAAGLVCNRLPRPVAVYIIAAVCFFYGARTLARTYDWRSEVSLWQSAVRVQPDSARARSRLALAQWRIGLKSEAERNFQAALAMNSRDFETLYWKGLYLLERGQPEEARRLLGRAVEKKPRDSAALLALGHSLEALGEKEEAQEHYLRMLRLNPNDLGALFRLATMAQSMGNPTLAEHYSRRLLSIKPDQVDTLILLARVYGQRRQYPEAARILEEVSRLRPKDTSSLYNLAYSYRMSQRYIEARDTLNRLLELNPEDAQAWLEKADAERMLGNQDQAFADAHHALNLRPGFSDALRFLEQFESQQQEPAEEAISSATD